MKFLAQLKPGFNFILRKMFFRRVFILFVVGLVFFTFKFIYSLRTSKVLDGVSFSQQIRDRNGVLLRISLSGDEKYRVWTDIKTLPKTYLQSVLLMEDQYFYFHPGINPVSLFKSVVASLTSQKNLPGASTITMQLARLRYGLKTKTISGKLIQIIYALDLEFRHTKDEILEAYVNLIPFGGPIEGVHGASLILYGKEPKDLSTAESLLLATIPQNPNQRRLDSSTLELNSEMIMAFERLKLKWIKRFPVEDLALKHIDLRSIRKGLSELPFLAPHFTEFVRSKSEDINVVTTLDIKLQKRIEVLLQHYLKSKKHLGVHNAAVMVSNSKSGEILSYIGSGGFFNSEIFGQNDGLQARRSPGSTLKPFVYALALQQGLIHPGTLLKDLPIQYALYEPENFDQNFLGPVTATQALIQSRNIPAVELSFKLSKPDFYEFLQTADIYFPKSPEYYGLSLVLGGAELTPWKISELYSMLARHGTWSELKWHLDQKEKSKKLLEPEAAFMTLDMLASGPKPNQDVSSKWMLSNLPVAWKTGTSHGFRDAWTSGLIGPYTIVVWFGNFDNSMNHAFVGKDLAAPFFFHVADLLKSLKFNENNERHENDVVHENVEDLFKDPEWLYTEALKVKQIQVCAVSGHVPGAHCEHRKSVWYYPGVSPISRCDVHRPIVIDVSTHKRSCPGDLEGDFKNTVLEVYEFWPNDIKKLFQSAGIHRKEPPGFSSECVEDQSFETASGVGPKIISPQRNVVFLKSQSLKEHLNTISLNAVVDGDSSYMHWYLDKKFIKKTKSDETFVIEPPLGHHKITVVDEHGRTDTQDITVQTVQ